MLNCTLPTAVVLMLMLLQGRINDLEEGDSGLARSISSYLVVEVFRLPGSVVFVCAVVAAEDVHVNTV